MGITRVLNFFKNFYAWSGLLFLIWITFLDSNNLISRYRVARRLHSLAQEKEYYEEKLKDIEKDRKELLHNDKLVEKYAREKYLMKKKTEDLFILAEK